MANARLANRSLDLWWRFRARLAERGSAQGQPRYRRAHPRSAARARPAPQRTIERQARNHQTMVQRVDNPAANEGTTLPRHITQDHAQQKRGPQAINRGVRQTGQQRRNTDCRPSAPGVAARAASGRNRVPGINGTRRRPGGMQRVIKKP